MLAAVIGAGTGCADRLGPEDVVGVYVLQSVNGQRLPAFVADGTRFGTSVTADTLTLQADGTLREIWHMGDTGRASPVVAGTGAWRVKGTDIELTYDALPATVYAYDGPTFTGARRGGDTLMVAESPVGDAAVYARR